ncbi:hypothetical protein [Agrococcus sp. ARC_14]|uniref:hypothetical protein n=1 Tax=Agrococcus sp. ARC_14 TaxID=2919927 RepID=UPI001F069935|nr:hypothetical protein [Agrococcus sp. ARC_14]MCH1884031.1 hypothetical protein [Agrococcus sp. ARC_14]
MSSPAPAFDARGVRLAGGVGGGIAWLGLGVAQACLLLLLLPGHIGEVVFSYSAYEPNLELPPSGPIAWFGSPWGAVLVAGIVLGIVVWLVGLRVSSVLLRAVRTARPARVTWIGFLLVAATGGIVAAVCCGAILDAFGGARAIMGDATLESGLPAAIFAPADLLPQTAPVVALATFVPLLLPVILSAFASWLAAQVLRREPAHTDRAA